LRKALFFVVLVHLLALFCVCVISDYARAIHPTFELLNSQATLVGIWFGLAPVGRRLRYLGLVAGIVVLWLSLFAYWATFSRTAPLMLDFLFALAASALPVLAVSLATSLIWGRACQVDSALGLGRTQFTMRHLLAFTLCIASFAGILRAIDRYEQSVGMTVFWIVAEFTLHAVLIGGVGVWAAFGSGRVLWRLAAVSLVLPMLAFLKLSILVHGPAFVFGEFFVVFSSLLVFRALGFRVGTPRQAPHLTGAADQAQSARRT